MKNGVYILREVYQEETFESLAILFEELILVDESYEQDGSQLRDIGYFDHVRTQVFKGESETSTLIYIGEY